MRIVLQRGTRLARLNWLVEWPRDLAIEFAAVRIFRRLLLVLSVATAVVGILRVGGGGKSRVTTKQGGWRNFSPPQ